MLKEKKVKIKNKVVAVTMNEAAYNRLIRNAIICGVTKQKFLLLLFEMNIDVIEKTKLCGVYDIRFLLSKMSDVLKSWANEEIKKQ